MKIVLLPGLDGTGELFHEFVKGLKSEHQIISYPETGQQAFSYLLQHIEAQLPKAENFVLIGESFSGPLAFKLASRNTINLKKVVFVATFLAPPRPFISSLAMVIPAKLFSYSSISRSIVEKLCFGKESSKEIKAVFWQIIRRLDQSTISERLRAASQVKTFVGNSKVTIPALFIRAQGDFLVPKSCQNLLISRCTNISLHNIDCPHFVLQSKPTQSSNVVNCWLES